YGKQREVLESCVVGDRVSCPYRQLGLRESQAPWVNSVADRSVVAGELAGQCDDRSLELRLPAVLIQKRFFDHCVSPVRLRWCVFSFESAHSPAPSPLDPTDVDERRGAGLAGVQATPISGSHQAPGELWHPLLRQAPRRGHASFTSHS